MTIAVGDPKWGKFSTEKTVTEYLRMANGQKSGARDFILVNSLKTDVQGNCLLNVSGKNMKISSLRRDKSGAVSMYPRDAAPITLANDSYTIALQDLIINGPELDIVTKPTIAAVEVKPSELNFVKFKTINKDLIELDRSSLIWKLWNMDADNQYSVETGPALTYKILAVKNKSYNGAWVSGSDLVFKDSAKARTAEISAAAFKKPKNHVLSRFFERLLEKKLKSVPMQVRLRKLRRQKVSHVVHDATIKNINMLTKNFMDEQTNEMLQDLLRDFNLEHKAH
jgi:hypothetical protein